VRRPCVNVECATTLALHGGTRTAGSKAPAPKRSKVYVAAVSAEEPVTVRIRSRTGTTEPLVRPERPTGALSAGC
jgi:hypothetical protein